MALPIIYNNEVTKALCTRINLLNPNSDAKWGKMNVSQMLAHLNVMFELGLEQKHKPPNGFVRFMLQSFVKNKITNEVPYKKNSMTAPEMVIKHQPDFETEKSRVVNYLHNIEQNGKEFFDQREHPSFGKLNAIEWSNLFYKHIDHHLKQFGV
jgi:hypothetical protein